MKTIITVVVLLLVAVGIWYVTRGPVSQTGPIKIGFIGPLSGDAATYGEPMRNAVSLAVDEINASGGVKGRQIEVIYEDGKCNGKDAATATQKLINVDKVKIIIGGTCSGETLGAAPIAEAAKVILFSPGSGSPDITNAGDYIFRNFPSDASSGKKMAELAIERNLKKVALLVETTDYAQALKKVFMKRFTELGGTVVADEAFTSAATDMRTQITKIKSANPAAVYLVPQTPARAEIALRQFGELGLKTQILSNEIINSDIILKDVGPRVEGVLYAEPAFDENAPLSKTYLDKHKAKYGTLGQGLPSIYLATAYDAVYILKELLTQYGEDIGKIKAGLYAIKNRQGTAGRLTIDQNGDPVFEYVVKTIKGGKPAEVR